MDEAPHASRASMLVVRGTGMEAACGNRPAGAVCSERDTCEHSVDCAVPFGQLLHTRRVQRARAGRALCGRRVVRGGTHAPGGSRTRRSKQASKRASEQADNRGARIPDCYGKRCREGSRRYKLGGADALAPSDLPDPAQKARTPSALIRRPSAAAPNRPWSRRTTTREHRMLGANMQHDAWQADARARSVRRMGCGDSARGACSSSYRTSASTSRLSSQRTAKTKYGVDKRLPKRTERRTNRWSHAGVVRPGSARAAWSCTANNNSSTSWM